MPQAKFALQKMEKTHLWQDLHKDVKEDLIKKWNNLEEEKQKKVLQMFKAAEQKPEETFDIFVYDVKLVEFNIKKEISNTPVKVPCSKNLDTCPTIIQK